MLVLVEVEARKEDWSHIVEGIECHTYTFRFNLLGNRKTFLFFERMSDMIRIFGGLI